MIKEVRWDITGKCNLNCTHCQAAKFYRDEKDRKDLTTSEVFAVIDRLKQAGILKVGLLGGEPLLRNDILEILHYFQKKGIKVTLNTNLLLLERFDLDKLLGYLDTIFVSLDGTTREEHEKIRGDNTFEKTIENIKKLTSHRRKIRVDVSYVINKYNCSSVKSLYSFMKSLGIDTCMVDIVHKVGNAEENWEKLAISLDEEMDVVKNLVESWDFSDDVTLNLRMYTNKFRDYLEKVTGIHLKDKLVWDAPGKTSLYILNDGTVVPTQFMMYMERERFKSKSLKNFDLEEIITSDSFVDFLELYHRDLPHNYYEPCKGCKYCGKQCNPSPVSFWLGKKIPIDICTIG